MGDYISVVLSLDLSCFSKLSLFSLDYFSKVPIYNCYSSLNVTKKPPEALTIMEV